jgi:hypothetical protein
LAAACLAKSPVPFDCLSKCFQNPDGSQLLIEILGGQAHSIKVPPPPPESQEKEPAPDTQESPQPMEVAVEADPEAETENALAPQPEPTPEAKSPSQDPTQPIENSDTEQPSYDREISVNNRDIEVAEGDPFTDEIVQICEYFRERVAVLYDCNVKEMTLKFGVQEESHRIYLLSGSVCTTTNGFSNNLMENVPNGDAEFTDFITTELSTPVPTGGVCITDAPTCSKGDYRCLRIFVILHRALQRFPGINEARIYRVIKSRIKAVNPDIINQRVNVCISCLHIYTAEQRIYQGRKLANQIPRTVDPPLFGELTPAELSIKGKRDVGLTMRSHDPYCYMINLMNSPYRGDPLPLIPPPERPFIHAIPPIPAAEPWVARLYHSQVTRSIKTVDADRNPFVRKHYDTTIPTIPPCRASFSQETAPGVYTNRPFQYAFLEKVRLRANRNIRLVQRSALK